MLGAAIGRDVRVTSHDAGTDRMRRARAASQSARSRRDLDQRRMSYFAAISVRRRRARRGRRRARGVRVAMLQCVVHGIVRRTVLHVHRRCSLPREIL